MGEMVQATVACHPDEVSNASGWKDLGQRGVSAAGSGFEFCIRLESDHGSKGPLRDFKTGAGFACAKLSGSQKPCPPVANAPVVRMTETTLALLALSG